MGTIPGTGNRKGKNSCILVIPVPVLLAWYLAKIGISLPVKTYYLHLILDDLVNLKCLYILGLI